MTRYGAVSIAIGQGFQLHSTEPEVVDWVVAQVKQAFPKYKFRNPHKYGFLANDATDYTEHNLHLLSLLMQDGWEPFAVVAWTYHLRKRFEA